MKTETILKLALELESRGVAMNRVAERLTDLGRKITNDLLFETMAEQDHRTKLTKIAVNLSTQKNEKIKAELWRLFLAA